MFRNPFQPEKFHLTITYSAVQIRRSCAATAQGSRYFPDSSQNIAMQKYMFTRGSHFSFALLHPASRLNLKFKHCDAGWSSPVARQAHNLKVVSSNLAPATKSEEKTPANSTFAGVFHLVSIFCTQQYQALSIVSSNQVAQACSHRPKAIQSSKS
jgi:hypothetical protein